LTTILVHIDIKNYDWVRDPFNVSISDLVDLQLAEEENLCPFKNDRTLQLKFKEITINKFLYSYHCEQGFSALTNIKK